MIVHTVFAIILGNDVKNVTVGNYTNVSEVAHAIFGNESYAIEITQFPVEEGDKYIDGEFRRYSEDGTYQVIEYIPTVEEQVTVLTNQLAQLQEEKSELEEAVQDLIISALD